MRKPRIFYALLFAASFGVTLNAAAEQIVGNLSTNHGATISGQGLDVKVQPGQDYPVFSGDRIQSQAGEGASVLSIPDAGLLKLSKDTVISVERTGDRYTLVVLRGEVGFELTPGAKVTLTSASGEGRFDLGQGTGKGAATVSADGSGGYLALADGSGGVKVMQLWSGTLAYEGEAVPELIEAQLGEAVGAAVVGGGGGATVPLVLGASAGVGALFSSSGTSEGNRTQDDANGTSLTSGPN